MATAARARAGSGGKILRPRRVARIATPYDRPPNPTPPPERPNWISKLILSPTRIIASGAGKLLSSVFSPESSSSSSSSSSASSGSGSGSDNEIEEDNNGDDNSSPIIDELNEERSKSGAARPLAKEANENKLLIEQLLLQETFSWEEYKKLTNIIKSRVVETPLHLDREVGRPDVDMPDLCNTALMEAKKWLQDKKSGSRPELDLDPTILPHVNEGEMGSPVDVAKSFMKDRPPWTSPCLTGEAQRSVSPISTQLFKDDEPFSIGGNSLSSSRVQLKKDTPIIGSWNISEEIRRVRSKATEQMLRTPSTKIDLSASKPQSSAIKCDWSGLLLGHKYILNSSAHNISEAGLRGKNQTSTNLIDSFSEVPAINTANETPMATENWWDNELPSPKPPVLISEQDKDFSGKMTNEDQGVGDGAGDIRTVLLSDTYGLDGITHTDTNGNSQADFIPDSRPNHVFHSMSKEGSGSGDASIQNGLPHSPSRLNADERDVRPYDEELHPPASGLPASHLEETSEPQKGTPIEAPHANENDGITTGSQNSSSMQLEEMWQEVNQESPKQAATSKRGRKVTRFGRKVKGRGK